jgi:ABC-2 type transport system permease protein
MSPRRLFATTGRVLMQLRHDPRTVALILGMPPLLMALMKYVFDAQPKAFDAVAPMLLGIFPLVVMFLVTSIATLRERTSGTLDRLMSQPISKLDFIFGYGLAFSIVGFLQAALASLIMVGPLGVTIQNGVWPVLVTAVAAALLGTSFGLFVSAFAHNEFQAVQFVMPFIMPQVLLCGMFIARDQMADWLYKISDWLPLTYSVDAMKQATTHATWTDDLTKDLLIVFGSALLALILGAITIRRRE